MRCLIRKTHIMDEEIKNLMTYTKKQLPKLPAAYRVRALIYQCKNLEAADDNGLADPYVKIWGKIKSPEDLTEAHTKTLNPIFYEVKEKYIDVFADLKEVMKKGKDSKDY